MAEVMARRVSEIDRSNCDQYHQPLWIDDIRTVVWSHGWQRSYLGLYCSVCGKWLDWVPLSTFWKRKAQHNGESVLWEPAPSY